jgi:hypothetical protein
MSWLPLNQFNQDILVTTSEANEEFNIHSEAARLKSVDSCERKDQEQDRVPRASCMSTSAVDPGSSLGLKSTPEKEFQTRGHHEYSPASPSESLHHTVVTYNPSFATPQERMEFALKVW